MLKNHQQLSMIEFDPSFTEEAVFLIMAAKNENDPLVQNFHRERERLYQEAAGEDRDAAFQRLYAHYFDHCGLKGLFDKIVQEFPLLNHPGLSLFVKRVWSKSAEDTELYLQGDFKTVYVALMAGRVLEPEALSISLRHEFYRISDMLDPQFRYTPHIGLDGKNDLENNLIRDRFRVLWDMYIDARIRKKNHPSVTPIDKQKQEFRNVFFFLNDDEQQYILSQLEGYDRLRLMDLLSWAQDERSRKSVGEGGLRCPVCNFTCYEPVRSWSSATQLIVEEIKRDHPQWDPAQGICPQCFDLYHDRIKAVIYQWGI